MNRFTLHEGLRIPHWFAIVDHAQVGDDGERFVVGEYPDAGVAGMVLDALKRCDVMPGAGDFENAAYQAYVASILDPPSLWWRLKQAWSLWRSDSRIPTRQPVTDYRKATKEHDDVPF